MNVQETLGFLKKNKRLIAGVTLFAWGWILVYALAVYQPRYGSQALVIIKDSAVTSRYVEPERYYVRQTTSSSSSNPVLNTMELLKSATIREALREFMMKNHPEELKKLHIENQRDWQEFFGDGTGFIKAKNKPGTDLISISLKWPDPEIARGGLEVVLKAFQKTSREINTAEQANQSLYLDQQVKEMEIKLAAIRKQKSQYKQRSGTVDLRQESGNLVTSSIELANRLSELEAQAQGKESEVRRYQQIIGMNPTSGVEAVAIGQNSTMTNLQDELYRLSQQHAFLRATLTDINPKVKEVAAQIEQVKQDIEAETLRVLGGSERNTDAVIADGTRSEVISNMVAAQAEAQRLRSEAEVTKDRLAQINRQLSSLPKVEADLARIEQQEATLSQSLDLLRQRATEARLKEKQTLSNVFIINQPQIPLHPQFPDRLQLIVLGLFLGLGCGLAAAIGRELWLNRDKYRMMPLWPGPDGPPGRKSLPGETPEPEVEGASGNGHHNGRETSPVSQLEIVREHAQGIIREEAREYIHAHARDITVSEARRAAQNKARQFIRRYGRNITASEARRYVDDHGRAIATEQARRYVDDHGRDIATEQARGFIETQGRDIATEQVRRFIEAQGQPIITGHAREAAQRIIAGQARNIVAEQAQSVIRKEARDTVRENAWNITAQEARVIVENQAPGIIESQAPGIIAQQAPYIISRQAPEIIHRQTPDIVAKQAPYIIADQAPRIIAEQLPRLIAEQEREFEKQGEQQGITEQVRSIAEPPQPAVTQPSVAEPAPLYGHCPETSRNYVALTAEQPENHRKIRDSRPRFYSAKDNPKTKPKTESGSPLGLARLMRNKVGLF